MLFSRSARVLASPSEPALPAQMRSQRICRTRKHLRIVLMPILAAAAKLWPMSSKKTVSSALTPRRSNASWKNLGSGFLKVRTRVSVNSNSFRGLAPSSSPETFNTALDVVVKERAHEVVASALLVACPFLEGSPQLGNVDSFCSAGGRSLSRRDRSRRGKVVGQSGDFVSLRCCQGKGVSLRSERRGSLWSRANRPRSELIASTTRGSGSVAGSIIIAQSCSCMIVCNVSEGLAKASWQRGATILARTCFPSMLTCSGSFGHSAGAHVSSLSKEHPEWKAHRCRPACNTCDTTGCRMRRRSSGDRTRRRTRLD